MVRRGHTGYSFTKIEIRDYIVMIIGRKYFDQPVKYDLGTYDNIQMIKTGQGHDYATDCLLDDPNFWKYYKMIAIDLSKQQALDTDLYQLNWKSKTFMNCKIFFFIEVVKDAILDFSQRTLRVL